MSAPSLSSDRGFAGPLESVDDCTYRIPKLYKPGKRVDGLIFADDRLLPLLKSDRAAEQEANVASEEVGLGRPAGGGEED